MKKIAFTIFRYGEGIFGGTEAHCRMLAEHLAPYYQVEVLTTTIRYPGCPEQDFPAGESLENGILVRRFQCESRHEQYRQRRKPGCRARRVRYRLDQAGLLAPLASIHPVWTWNLEAEHSFFMTYEEYAPSLAEFVRTHKQEYAAILPICYYFSTTIFTALSAPEKCILIPTAHPEKPLYYSTYTHIFTRVAHIAFNTVSEQRLCRRIFGRHMAPSSIVGVGIETAESLPWDSVREKFGLPERYVLYVGRLHSEKIGNVVPEFIRYRKKYGDDIRLVLVGPGTLKSLHIPEHPAVIATGAVSEAEKSTIIRHATVMVNPSRMESLSLLLLEALHNRIPMLVNGKCEVMKDHCKLSGAALWYDSGRDFRRKLHRLLSDEALRRRMGEKGPVYVREHYGWEVVIPKLRALIEKLSSGRGKGLPGAAEDGTAEG